MADNNKFIKEKTIALKERKLQIELVKKRDEERRALKVAQDAAAAKAKVLAAAESAVSTAKRDVASAQMVHEMAW